MKVSIGYRIQDGPWGGGNNFVNSLTNYLIENDNIVIDHLQSNNARELINNASIDKLISSATTGSYSYTKIWGIIVLTAWMDRHKCHL